MFLNLVIGEPEIQKNISNIWKLVAIHFFPILIYSVNVFHILEIRRKIFGTVEPLTNSIINFLNIRIMFSFCLVICKMNISITRIHTQTKNTNRELHEFWEETEKIKLYGFGILEFVHIEWIFSVFCTFALCIYCTCT